MNCRIRRINEPTQSMIKQEVKSQIAKSMKSFEKDITAIVVYELIEELDVDPDKALTFSDKLIDDYNKLRRDYEAETDGEAQSIYWMKLHNLGIEPEDIGRAFNIKYRITEG